MEYYTEEFDKHGDYAFLKQHGGYFGVDPLPPMEMQIEGMDPRLTEHSMRLFAKEVMPHFRAQ